MHFILKLTSFLLMYIILIRSMLATAFSFLVLRRHLT